MKKYIFILLSFSFLSCEDEPDELTLEFSSINDGDIINYIPNSILLKFSDNISRNLFDAESINVLGYVENDPSDTTNVDGNVLREIDSNFYKIENSNFIKVNNEPQTLIYDSVNSTCLLLRFTNEYYPAGTGEGLDILEGENTINIGNYNYSKEITFNVGIKSTNPYLPNEELYNNVLVVPNPRIQAVEFGGYQHARRLVFINLPQKCVIDIYEINNEHHVDRIVHSSQLSGSALWDLRSFNNIYVPSGFYQYKFGTDTTNTGLLNPLLEDILQLFVNQIESMYMLKILDSISLKLIFILIEVKINWIAI